MLYIFLKNILETVLANYICPQCQNKITEQSMSVTGISSHGVDIHVQCPTCNTHSQLNAEINSIAAQMLENENGRKYFEEFLKQGGAIGATMKNPKNGEVHKIGIKDEDIIKIQGNLKNAKSVEDIMGQ